MAPGGPLLTGADAAAYRISGVVPTAVAAPSSTEEAAQLIRHAAERGWGLVPYGGGTQIETGFPPAKLDLLLSTRRLNRVVDYQPDDMTITVEPGVTLAEVERLLAGRNQLLPLDPPLPEQATAGGTVAAAVTGPWRAGFGTPRDWVIGCRVLDAKGEEIRAGGQVVKNVAGYDLPKLYTGSFGTLGLISEITFKVMPRPPARGYAQVRLRSAEEAERLIAETLDSDLQPASLELVYQPEEVGRPWSLYYEFLHVEEAIEWQAGKVAELAGPLDGLFDRPLLGVGDAYLRQLRDRPARAPFVARLGTVSARVADLASRAGDVARDAGLRAVVQCHAATGQVYVITEDASGELAAALRGLATAAGGTCTFLRLPAPLGGQVDPWGPVGPELRLMRGIKQALDPGGLFSPGCFVDRI